ncbi:MAG: glycosyl transferase [Lachnospiraceae bacterium]|nr:glycosyl transferase [Lachnospiraceae bacterium]
MIPKKIHYCWFGGNPLPKSAEKCLKSWEKYCPDYEIVRWDESNFDINCNEYCKAMYEQKKWAFLTDYSRLKIVFENGGIYFDTDVELIKSPDEVLSNRAFMGLETTNHVATGLGFGAEKNHPFIRKNMEYYEKLSEFDDIRICPDVTTELFEQYGIDCESDDIQKLADVTIYPVDFFCAKHTHTGIVSITSNTISIHHFDGSWMSEEMQNKTKRRWREHKKQYIMQAPKRLLRKIVGDGVVDNIKKQLLKK